jgi:hypothetical protein
VGGGVGTGGLGGGVGDPGGLPHSGSQLKHVSQQKPAIQGFAVTSHFPQDFCWAQLYWLPAGGTSGHASSATARDDIDMASFITLREMLKL